MKFRTEIEIAPLGTRIGHADTLLLLGSCFADEMRERLQRLKFRAEGNLTGPLFNPSSIASLLQRAQDPTPERPDSLHRDADGWWFHYAANTLLSDPDPATVLNRYNEALDRLRALLAEARCVIVTFGTAWVYRLKETDRIVANCHKQPQDLFRRERLSVRQIVDEWSELLAGPLSDKETIFTISPVRHLGDGLEGNSSSKATLRVAVAELTERFARAHYFPAYEILLDDLRDYRFYADDLVHPSAQAIEYIWERFVQAALSEPARTLLPEIETLVARCRHRPRRPDSEADRRMRRTTLDRMTRLARSAGIDFSEEIALLRDENSR